jgi:hypothetical protein
MSFLLAAPDPARAVTVKGPADQGLPRPRGFSTGLAWLQPGAIVHRRRRRRQASVGAARPLDQSPARPRPVMSPPAALELDA